MPHVLRNFLAALTPRYVCMECLGRGLSLCPGELRDKVQTLLFTRDDVEATVARCSFCEETRLSASCPPSGLGVHGLRSS